MDGTADRPPLALLEVLDRAAFVMVQALGFPTDERCRFEIVVDSGQVVEVWPHAEPGKLTRAELDRLVIPVAETG